MQSQVDLLVRSTAWMALGVGSVVTTSTLVPVSLVNGLPQASCQASSVAKSKVATRRNVRNP